ncbi:hypothetical protein BsWGS_07985 [Bradybaena similaris]
MFLPSRDHEVIDSQDSFLSLTSDESSHSIHQSVGQSSLFLPSYLLGDSQSHNYSVSSPLPWNSRTSNALPQTAAGTSRLGQNVPGQDILRGDRVKGNVAGPPVTGLFSSPTLQDLPRAAVQADNLESGRSQSSPALRRMAAPSRIGLQHSAESSQWSSSVESQRQGIPFSPSQGDSFSKHRDLNCNDVLDETWVTVFGFPPGASSFILQQFSLYGTVIKHIIISECNWMHIHYMTKIQAKKALSKNGRIFGGCMKIGVVPCAEKCVMEERNRHLLNAKSASTSDLGAGSQVPLRPLAAAYVATRSDYEVIQGKPVPKRDESMISRLKEYMFGY